MNYNIPPKRLKEIECKIDSYDDMDIVKMLMSKDMNQTLYNMVGVESQDEKILLDDLLKWFVQQNQVKSFLDSN